MRKTSKNFGYLYFGYYINIIDNQNFKKFFSFFPLIFETSSDCD